MMNSGPYDDMVKTEDFSMISTIEEGKYLAWRWNNTHAIVKKFFVRVIFSFRFRRDKQKLQKQKNLRLRA